MKTPSGEDFKIKRSVLLASAGALSLGPMLVGGNTMPAQAQQKTLKASPKQVEAIQSWTETLAVQAATYAAPLVAMYNLRASIAFGPNPKARPGTLWRIRDISTPAISAQSGYVSPNVDVIYGFGFADLGPEPIILTAPDSDGRYYMIDICDMYTNAFAYPAGGASGYKGGKFALVGPGWKGNCRTAFSESTLPRDGSKCSRA